MGVFAKRNARLSRVNKTLRGRVGVFFAATVVTSVLFINFCNLVYQCGCESLWAGAAEHCNIHNPESRHCPWCTIGTMGAVAIYGCIVAVQALVAFRWQGLGFLPRAIFALLAFPATGAILALLTGLAQGYWR
jgi:hypothetical protein